MAVVDVIDLTVSSPSVIFIEDEVKKPAAAPSRATEESKEKKKRKKRRREERERERREQRRQEEQEEQDKHRYTDSWTHDKFIDGDRHRQGSGDKRKWSDDADVSRSSKRRYHSLTPPPLFTIDTTRSDIAGGPVTVPPAIEILDVDAMVEPSSVEKGLLLPAHVTVSTQEPTSFLNDNPPLSPISDSSGIDFLDDDRAVGAPRYFQEMGANPKSARSRGPCTKCGDDDHHFRSCPNMICLTCGARNEHGTQSCPIVRFCWNCKAKGHISKDCPRIGDMDQQRLNRQDCERCGSWKHHGTNCPTFWRIYTYLTDKERDTVLADRATKSQLGFDGGGEGYIARDQWCYNCGGSGHLGDDCEAVPHNHDMPNEYSAFGSFNQLTGPFASPSFAVPNFERAPREWEEGGRFDDGYGFSAESNVGKRGRENAKAKAREAQRLLDEEDDEPDWFNNRAANDKAKAKPPRSKGKFGLPYKPQPPAMNFDFRKSSSSRTPMDSTPSLGSRPPSRPSLRDRIDTSDRPMLNHLHRDRGEKRGRDRRKESADSRSKGNYDARDRYSSRDDPRQERGSRWRGGYDR